MKKYLDILQQKLADERFSICVLVHGHNKHSIHTNQEGTVSLGGSVRFESVNEDYRPFNNTYKSNGFFISPAIGYFFINKMAAGLRIDFSSYHSKADSFETRSRSTAVSPFVRYYFLPVAKKVNAFLDVGYLHSKTKWTFSNSPFYGKSKGFQILAGPSIFLTGQIALEFTLGIKHIKSDSSLEPAKSNKLTTGFGLQIHLGKVKQKTT